MIDAVVWKEEGKWWARTYLNGRCDWVCYGFKSSGKAQRAVNSRLRERTA